MQGPSLSHWEGNRWCPCCDRRQGQLLQLESYQGQAWDPQPRTTEVLERSGSCLPSWERTEQPSSNALVLGVRLGPDPALPVSCCVWLRPRLFPNLSFLIY